MALSLSLRSVASKVKTYIKSFEANAFVVVKVKGDLITIDNLEGSSLALYNAAQVCNMATGMQFEAIGNSNARFAKQAKFTLAQIVEASYLLTTGKKVANKELERAASWCYNYLNANCTFASKQSVSYTWECAYLHYESDSINYINNLIPR